MKYHSVIIVPKYKMYQTNEKQKCGKGNKLLIVLQQLVITVQR